MKKTRKYVIALAAIAAGSVMYGTLPAHAGGIELEKAEIVFRRDHDDRGRDMPPPPPQGNYGPRGHVPPPPPPQHPHRAGHMPPPQHHSYGPRDHMPPPPPPQHYGPRGHMPPPPPHR